MGKIILDLVKSWSKLESDVTTIQEIKNWIEELNQTISVNIKRELSY